MIFFVGRIFKQTGGMDPSTLTTNSSYVVSNSNPPPNASQADSSPPSLVSSNAPPAIMLTPSKTTTTNANTISANNTTTSSDKYAQLNQHIQLFLLTAFFCGVSSVALRRLMELKQLWITQKKELNNKVFFFFFDRFFEGCSNAQLLCFIIVIVIREKSVCPLQTMKVKKNLNANVAKQITTRV
jgi:hypothetical protein